jgi:phosphoribosylformylglycinamidine (FGAM) synthase-like amidotransferase family enzyme
MMPHPERATESVLGSADGKTILQSMISALQNRKTSSAA